MRSKRGLVGATTARAVVVAFAAVLVAAPTGAFEVMKTTGKPGTHKVVDRIAKPGVVCKFEDRALKTDEELDRIWVRAVKARGRYSVKSWVGYRYSVLQRLAPSQDYEFVFKSKIRKQRASKTQPTTFSARSWSAPENMATSDFRILIDFIYYKKGSKTIKRGKIRGVMEVHRHKHPTEPSFLVGKPGSGGECFYNFWT